MTVRNCLIASFAILAVTTAFSQTDDLQTLFNEGNAAFADERYVDAVEAYEAAYANAEESSLALLFNLGNAYYHLQDYPAALLAYERALTLEPGNPDVLANLQKIIDQSDLERPQYSIAQEFAYTLPVNTWMLLLWIGSAITIVCGLLVWYAPRLAPIPTLGLYLAIPLMLMSTAGLLIWKQDFNRALILMPDTGLRLSPNTSGDVLSTISNGTWVEIIDAYEPYYVIQTPDKREGYVKDTELGKVWP